MTILDDILTNTSANTYYRIVIATSEGGTAYDIVNTDGAGSTDHIAAMRDGLSGVIDYVSSYAVHEVASTPPIS